MSKGSNPFDYCDGFYVHVQNRSVTSNWLRCERGMQCCHLSARFFLFLSFYGSPPQLLSFCVSATVCSTCHLRADRKLYRIPDRCIQFELRLKLSLEVHCWTGKLQHYYFTFFI